MPLPAQPRRSQVPGLLAAEPLREAGRASSRPLSFRAVASSEEKQIGGLLLTARPQIEDVRLSEVVRDGRYLEATDRVLKKHGGLWFNDETYVISRRRAQT